MATSRVFLLPELLEPILSHLPQRDLLLMQRVNHQWKVVITRSQFLQQQLFFKPSRICPLPEDSLAVDFNPLLQELFPPFFANLFTLDDCDVVADDDYLAMRYCTGRDEGVQILRKQEWYQSEAKRAAVLRPEASWRRMFVSNPPPRVGDLDIDLPGCGCYYGSLDGSVAPRYRHLNESLGWRMGLLWDLVVFILDDNPEGEFSVSWWRLRSREEDGKVRADQRDSWMLEWFIRTSHSWGCYECDEAYHPTGLKIVDNGDMVEYKEFVEGIAVEKLRLKEAVPLSVWARYEREGKLTTPAQPGVDTKAETEDSDRQDGEGGRRQRRVQRQ
ncbi:hypothetical protein BJY04DRAFT_175423 [Aspergillus karnatakaensis]|uniref:uncharacterized protein n=1 Tax=Aspergillus karnatakaensis TaxID=1810916 RepID=UPI003CCDFCC4